MTGRRTEAKVPHFDGDQRLALLKPAAEEPRRTALEDAVHHFFEVMRHKKLILVLTGVGALASGLVALASLKLPPDLNPLPNVYTATAQLFVQPNQGGLNDVSTSLGLPPEQSQSGRGPNYGLIALQFLESRTFADTIVARFGILSRYRIGENETGRAREAVAAHLKADYDLATGILVLRYTDTDAVFASEITNGTVDLLEQWFTERIGSSVMRAEKLLGDRLQEVRDQMAALQSEAEAFQRRYGVLSVEELSRLRSDILSKLQSQLVLVETEIRTRSATTTIQDPTVSALRSQQSSLKSMAAQVQSGTGEFGGLPAAEELPALSQKMSKLQTDMAIQDKIYQTLSQQYEVLKLDLQAMPIFQVLERAQVPDRKSGPFRVPFVLTATAAAFALGVLAALALNVLPRAGELYRRERSRRA